MSLTQLQCCCGLEAMGAEADGFQGVGDPEEMV